LKENEDARIFIFFQRRGDKRLPCNRATAADLCLYERAGGKPAIFVGAPPS